MPLVLRWPRPGAIRTNYTHQNRPRLWWTIKGRTTFQAANRGERHVSKANTSLRMHTCSCGRPLLLRRPIASSVECACS